MAVGAARPGWAFLPALGGALAHAPLLRYDLLPSLDRPLDLGAAPGGTRLFGDNKTIRGALAMASGTLAATLLLHRLEPYRRRLPAELRDGRPAAPRRAARRRGRARRAAQQRAEAPARHRARRAASSPVGVALAIHDQADFVLGAWPLLAPIWRMSARELAEAFALVAGVHMGVNLAGYALGARASPL